jgi:hypothetical protein
VRPLALFTARRSSPVRSSSSGCSSVVSSRPLLLFPNCYLRLWRVCHTFDLPHSYPYIRPHSSILQGLLQALRRLRDFNLPTFQAQYKLFHPKLPQLKPSKEDSQSNPARSGTFSYSLLYRHLRPHFALDQGWIFSVAISFVCVTT